MWHFLAIAFVVAFSELALSQTTHYKLDLNDEKVAMHHMSLALLLDLPLRQTADVVDTRGMIKTTYFLSRSDPKALVMHMLDLMRPGTVMSWDENRRSITVTTSTWNERAVYRRIINVEQGPTRWSQRVRRD
ncbi:MAG: hypothetical protein NXI32_21515 [bacterium]|nr:hypothetical protein [bacterium]